MSRARVWALLWALLICGYGCATATQSFGQALTIASTPAWASFRVVGDPTIYFTPAELQLAQNRSYLVRLEKDGYDPVLLRINISSADLETLKGCPSKWNVQALSEAQYRIMGDMLMVTLKPLPEPVYVPPPVVQPPPGLSEEPKPEKVLKERLLELRRMRKRGIITAKEYKDLRKKALEGYK